MTDKSNDEFFTELGSLIDGWCEKRSLLPLSKILGPYLNFNGLTDGWADLATGLKSIRAMDRELPGSERAKVDDLVRTADARICRG